MKTTLPLITLFVTTFSAFAGNIEVSAVITGPAANSISSILSKNTADRSTFILPKLLTPELRISEIQNSKEYRIATIGSRYKGKFVPDKFETINLGVSIPIVVSSQNGEINYHGQCEITSLDDSWKKIDAAAENVLLFYSYSTRKTAFAGVVKSGQSVSIPLINSSDKSYLKLTFIEMKTEQGAAANP